MKNCFTTFGTLFLLLIGSGVALAESLDCREADDKSRAKLSEVSRSYSKLSSLQADFEQSSFFLGLGDTVVSSGHLAFQRPGRMDWVYRSPESQRFVADGKRVWFYQPDLNQVTVGDFDNAFSSDLPVSFLVGVGEITTSFDLLKFCSGLEREQYFLKPKVEDPNLKNFVLFVEPKSKLPSGARVVDVGGNETQITLTNIRSGTEFKKDRFVFTIPSGVDVIDQSSFSPIAGASIDEESISLEGKDNE